MPLDFRYRRTKTGVGDDADPNASAPASSALIRLPVKRSDLIQVPSYGWIYYLIFLDSSDAEITDGTAGAKVTPYLQDNSDASWAAAASDTLVRHRTAYTNRQTPVHDATVFFRLQNITGTDVASVEIRVEVI